MLIYGRNAVLEALREGQAERVLVAKGIQASALKELEQAALSSDTPLEQVPRIHLDQALKTTNHQGVAALLPEVPLATLDAALQLATERGERVLLVLLDHLTDPRNVGAIIRSAEALGAHGVVMEERRSAPLTAVVVKASAGATSLIPIVVVTNLARTIEQLKESGVWVYGAAAAEDAGQDAAGAATAAAAGKSGAKGAHKGGHQQTPEQIDWDRDAALVIGSEGSGLRRLVRERCDGLVALPMSGRIGSLNASVAAGILLYCVQRGRAASKG